MNDGAILTLIDALPAEKRAMLARLLRPEREPIAIIGMGCRLPRGVTDPERFWRLLHDGVDAITTIPDDRWDGETIFNPDPTVVGKVNTRWGGFLDRIDQFDTRFFLITAREAEHMDPQQRLLLEVAWEALEDGGQTREQLAGTRTGVFIGACNSDHILRSFADSRAIEPYTLSGSAHSILAGRLSYFLDLKGPSIAVDTACSSSLVAIHLALSSLRSGESDLAVVGGVNVMLSPEVMIAVAKWGALAADGRCKTFDARADGFVRGEGCGVVVLKRLSQALADHDRVLALIRGSAVNQDGRSAGLTAPNLLSQQGVIRQALADAAIEPHQIGYVEAHGTGTALGDPIELEALKGVLGHPRRDGEVCAIGSVKTNIGHLEAAAGIVGLIKVVLSLQKGEIPPHLHFRHLNPNVSLEGTPFVIPTEPRAWPSAGTPRRAGVSSFGFSGTNAHVILEEAPPSPEPEATHEDVPGRACLLPISARSREALRALAASYRDVLAGAESHPSLRDICYTASVRRTHHKHRLAVVGHSREEIADRLERFLGGDVGSPTCIASSAVEKHHKLVFVFTRQAPHLLRTARRLVEQEPVFRTTLEACDAWARRHASGSLLEQLRAEQSELPVEWAPPALFAFQVGLAATWRSWGIEPDAVAGDGVGEIAAAHVAGALPLDAALDLVVVRSSLMRRRTDTALQARFERALRALAPEAGTVPIFSAVPGRMITGRELDATYWRRTVDRPLSLATALDGLKHCGCDLALEIAPDRDLAAAISPRAPSRPQEPDTIRLLPGTDDEPAMMLASLGTFYALGYAIEWVNLHANRGRCVRLPSYPWQRKSYGPKAARVERRRQPVPDPRPPAPRREHPLLGSYMPSAIPPERHYWELDCDAATFPYLADHRLHHATVLPASAWIEMALAAGTRLFGSGECGLEEVSFDEPLSLHEGARRVQLVASRQSSENATFEVFSRRVELQSARWIRHASGTLRWTQLEASAASTTDVSLNGVQARCPTHIEPSVLYQDLQSRGLHYGTSFQGIGEIWRGDREVLAHIRWPEGLHTDTDDYMIHPAVLDACLQVLQVPAIAASDADRLTGGGVYLAGRVGSVRIRDRARGPLWSHAVLRAAMQRDAPTIGGDVRIFDEEGRLVIEILGVTLAPWGSRTESTRPRQAIVMSLRPVHEPSP